MRTSPSLRSALLVAAATWLTACNMLPALLGQSPAVEGEGSGGADAGDDEDGGGGAAVVTCQVETVDDPAACGEACDAVIEGFDGRSMCTTVCDVELQDCEGNGYRCEVTQHDVGACFLDCSGGNACPDDYACDQEDELCIPVSPD